MQSFRDLKKFINLPVSPSPERDESGKRRRAESPPLPTTEHLEQQRIQAQAKEEARQQIALARQQASLRVEALQFMHNHDVNEIINSINEYLTSFFGEEKVNVDHEDPSIRYIVGMIVTSNNFRISAAQKLRRSRLLLQAVVNVIINRVRTGAGGFGNVVERLLPVIRTGIINAGRFLFKVGATTGRVAYNAASLAGRAAFNTASAVASSIRIFAPRPLVEEVQGRAASSPPRQSMHDMASAAVESVAAGLPEFYDALTRVLGRVYDLLAQCGAAGASVVSRGFKRLRAMCSTPEQAVGDAVNQVVPEEQVDNCPVCMEQAIGPNIVYTIPCNHKFHRDCINGWLQYKRDCPTCRGEVTRTSHMPSQAGGGSRKTRSKSKSKTRRLRKSRNKSRKPRKSCKSRKPRSSSRRR